MYVVIMAGGLGKRMNSDLPKVLHTINGVPMLVKIIVTALKLTPDKILIVVGRYKQLIEATVNRFITDCSKIEYITQEPALGTGHAVACCRDYLLQINTNIDKNLESNVLILSGDVPLITEQTLQSILSSMTLADNKALIVTTKMEDPHGYGRIISEQMQFVKIVEEKDCSESERTIQQVNTGIYVFDKALLCKYLPYITNSNSQNEYYLTDIVEIIKTREKVQVGLYEIERERQHEIVGVNTPEQLTFLETHGETPLTPNYVLDLARGQRSIVPR